MDMTSPTIGPIAVVILVPAILGWLLSKSAVKARSEGGRLWLEYGWPLKGFALFIGGLVVLLVGLWFLADPGSRSPIAWITALFGALGIPLLIEVFGVRIGFDERQIYCISGWRRNRIIPWSSIRACRYSAANRWWVIRTDGYGTIRVHEFLSGRASFFQAMRSKTGIHP